MTGGKLTTKQLEAIKTKSSQLEKARSTAQAAVASLMQPSGGAPDNTAQFDEADVAATPMSEADLMVAFEKYKEEATNAIEAKDMQKAQIAASDLSMSIEQFISDKGSNSKTYKKVFDAYREVFGDDKIGSAVQAATSATDSGDQLRLPSDLAVTLTPMQMLAAGGIVAAPVLGAYAVKALGNGSNSAAALEAVLAALKRPGIALLPASADGTPATRASIATKAVSSVAKAASTSLRKNPAAAKVVSWVSGRNPRDREVLQPTSQADKRLLKPTLQTTITILTQE